MYQEMMAKRHRDRHHIKKLEDLLSKYEIELPPLEEMREHVKHVKEQARTIGLLEGNTNDDALNTILNQYKALRGRFYQVQIVFKELNYWTMAPKPIIPTVGTTLRRMIVGSGKKHHVDILKGLTGIFRLRICTCDNGFSI
jgi:hypothetical protein